MSLVGELESKLQSEPAVIGGSFRENQIPLNINKTKAMLIGNITVQDFIAYDLVRSY